MMGSAWTSFFSTFFYTVKKNNTLVNYNYNYKIKTKQFINQNKTIIKQNLNFYTSATVLLVTTCA